MAEKVQQSPDMREGPNPLRGGGGPARGGVPGNNPGGPPPDASTPVDKILSPELLNDPSQVGRAVGPVQVGADSEEGALMDHERDRDQQEEEQSAIAGSQDGGRSAHGGKLRQD